VARAHARSDNICRHKVDEALGLLQPILLTPSAPESSIITSDKLHALACPTGHGDGSKERLASNVAVALLLNQTFRYTRLEEVCARFPRRFLV